MLRILLRGIITAIATVSLAACASGGQEPPEPTTQLKLAFNQGTDHPQYQALSDLSTKLKDATDGRYSLKIYPEEQLGGQSDVIRNVVNGTVDMMVASGPVLEGYNDDFIVYDLPYVFDSKESFRSTMRKEIVTDELFATTTSHGFTTLGAFYAGTRNVYSTKGPVTSVDDFKGLTIRVQQSVSQTKMMETLGATATPMGLGGVYSALQTKSIDAAENNESIFHEEHHDEVATYYSYTRHQMIPDYLLINNVSLAAMSDEDRATFHSLVAAAIDQSDDAMDDFLIASRKAAEQAGCTFEEDVNVEAIKKALSPLVEEALDDNDERSALYDAIG